MRTWPFQLLDGKVLARRCQVNVVENCNLSCRSCSHLSPVLPKYSVEPSALYRDLKILSRHYHARYLELLGGEPLLHADLLGVIDAARRSTVADEICVLTNGTRLPRMPEEFWERVDRVTVSSYPGHELSEEASNLCLQRARSAGVELVFESKDDFRESYSELGTTNRRLVRAIYESCAVIHDWGCHTVALGRFYKCPQAYFLPKVVDACAGNQERDSIRIADSEDFGRDLKAFLQSSRPLVSCGYCLGTSGCRFPQSQVRRVVFRKMQQRTAEELVDPALLVPIRPRHLRSLRPRHFRSLKRSFTSRLQRARSPSGSPG